MLHQPMTVDREEIIGRYRGNVARIVERPEASGFPRAIGSATSTDIEGRAVRTIRMVSSAIVLSVAAFAAGCVGKTPSDAQREERSASAGSPAVDTVGQARQLRAAANDPATIDDKLFILWEYAGALRERELAIAVLAKATDPEVKALAVLVRDGHQFGMDAMKPAAAKLGLILPQGATDMERAAIEAATALPTADLEHFFLRRQRAMHAWDITVFDDYRDVAANESLKRYVAATRQPLREHGEIVVKLANRMGISGGLAEMGEPTR